MKVYWHHRNEAYMSLNLNFCTSSIFWENVKSPQNLASIAVIVFVYNYGLLQPWLLWQYGLWSFLAGGTKLERFLPKNQHTQRKLLNFVNWVNGEVSESAKIWLFCVKNGWIFLHFFFIEKYQFRSSCFVIDIFWQHQFLNQFYY